MQTSVRELAAGPGLLEQRDVLRQRRQAWAPERNPAYVDDAEFPTRVLIRPVFSARSDARRRLLRRSGYLAVVACFGYLVMVAFSLTASPGDRPAAAGQRPRAPVTHAVASAPRPRRDEIVEPFVAPAAMLPADPDGDGGNVVRRLIAHPATRTTAPPTTKVLRAVAPPHQSVRQHPTPKPRSAPASAPALSPTASPHQVSVKPTAG